MCRLPNRADDKISTDADMVRTVAATVLNMLHGGATTCDKASP